MNTRAAHFLALALALALALPLAACGQFGRSGPYAGVVARSAGAPLAGAAPIAVVDLAGDAARAALAGRHQPDFAATFGEVDAAGTVIGRGDTIDIAIWEAPPAALFGTVSMQNSAGSGIQAARSAGLPEQMVDESGRVMVPFVGAVIAAGRTPRAIEGEIAERLRGKANHPQVVVRVTHNALQAVSVLGDVTNAGRFPITPHGERVLDALAYAGGAKQPVTRTVLQITRGTHVATMPLDTVIRQPAQNIRLAPDDVVTALFQPWSYTVLGATGSNAEIPFEATGLSLAQALGRAGGLADNRADMRGVFVFRLEDPAVVAMLPGVVPHPLPDGRVPVIYRLDLSDPAAFFTAQGFAVRDHDVLYVSNAPGADLQKFAMTLANFAYAGLGIVNQVK